VGLSLSARISTSAGNVNLRYNPCLEIRGQEHSNTILKGAEDNGVGFILESNGSPVTLLNITNSSKGYTNLKEIAAKSKLTDTTVSIPITASYYVYDTNKIKSGALEATALINVKYD
ncbi:fimbrial protein, partial [Escherichia coli]|uniref:fimbrial protein n=1 Tax=Escherichia coli TaxID=562 RepID=UPI0030F3D278